MTSFAYWIFGYQKFAEPIIRECIALKTGWKDACKEIRTPPISTIISNMQLRNDWDQDFPMLKEQALRELSKRKRAMVLDGAFINNGIPIIAEFKSWGGFHVFSSGELYSELVKGNLFSDRLAINSIFYNNELVPVTNYAIATSISDIGSNPVQWKIGSLNIHVFDISALLKEFGWQAAEKCGAINQLNNSVTKVQNFLKTGELK